MALLLGYQARYSQRLPVDEEREKGLMALSLGCHDFMFFIVMRGAYHSLALYYKLFLHVVESMFEDDQWASLVKMSVLWW